MMIKNIILITISLFFLVCSCETKKENTEPQFVKQKDGLFMIGDSTYYFVGTNYWYGAILGSTGQGGNRKRLLQELDFMKENGINNLRILVGADGETSETIKVMPSLQLKPGVYNDTIFDGLDFLLYEMQKRKMYAVLYLNNSWEWSGGYGQYLNWAGYGDIPKEGTKDWPKYLSFVSQYAECDSCHTLFLNHVKKVITRTNKYTGKKYIDDTAIMSWQVGNEPRVFSNQGKPAFVKWMKETTALIRSLDKNHMISTGNEGRMGCEGDIDLFEQIHSDANVDYLTIHIWPKNWSWIDVDNITGSIDTAIVKTNKYIQEHLVVAKKLKKPVVIEEFGFPRDNHKFSLDDPTSARDKYYENIFNQIVKASQNKELLVGCNFWAWGGIARPQHKYWQPWDDYVGDPTQEEQGLNSVFDTDSTIKVIKKCANQIKFTK